MPLGFVTSSANRHDSRLLDELLQSRYIATDRRRSVFNLCLDAGFTGKEETARKHGYTPHIRPRGEERLLIETTEFTARRWVVEACHSWVKRFRKLAISYEKTKESFEGLLKLALGLITWGKVIEKV